VAVGEVGDRRLMDRVRRDDELGAAFAEIG
jgi:hypothetical protein